MAKSCYSTAADHEHFGMNQAEMNTIDCLIEGTPGSEMFAQAGLFME